MNVYYQFRYQYDLDKLKMERIRQGMSMREMADKSELDIKTVMRVEQKQVTPRPQTVGKMIRVLGMELEDFILG